MRVTEALFQQICQFGMAGGEHHLHCIDISKNSCGLIFDRFQPGHFVHSKINHYKTKHVSKFRLLNNFKPVHSQFKISVALTKCILSIREIIPD
jgi:hypothetical protein